MTWYEYLSAAAERSCMQADRKMEQVAELEEAKQRALDEVRVYLAGLSIERGTFDAA